MAPVTSCLAVSFIYGGAHDRNRTGEPLPYQGSALPTELRGHHSLKTGNMRSIFYQADRSAFAFMERETRLELATFSLEG